MAGEDENKERRDGGGGGGGSNNSQQRKGSPPARRRRKGPGDPTWWLGTAIWSISAIFTAIAFSNLTRASIPDICRTPGAPWEQCSPYYFRSLGIFVVAIVVQIALTLAKRRFRNQTWNKAVSWVDYVLNVFGFYWVTVVWLGLFPELRALVQYISSQMSLGLVSTIILFSVVSVFLEDLAGQFWGAPPAQ